MQPKTRQSLPKATTIGLVLIVALLIVNMLVSQWNTERLIENEHRVIQSQMVLTTLEEVLSRVTEAETGERGYLITGDTGYLRAYEGAIDRTGDTLVRLTEFATGDSERLTQIQALRDRVESRFDELRSAIAAQQANGFDAAKNSVSANQGRKLMNEMRQLVNDMQRQEQEMLAIRSDESWRSARMTMINELVGSLLGIGLVGLAFFLFRRELAHRQRAEDALRRLAAIVESSDDAIVSKTLEGRVVSWNAGAQHIYGYPAEEAIGQPITMLCPPECADGVYDNLELVRRGVHIAHFETTRLCKDGCQIDVSLSISPIKDGSGTVIGASAIARDVTERKLLQREVLEIAAREQRRIGQDLHDGTGQELTGLAMMTERLAGELGQRSLPQARIATRIVDGLEKALRHVRSLSKGLVPVELDAEGLMVALADLATRTSEMHAVACEFQCEEPVSIVDNETATHLYRLSQEAVTNAVKHGHAEHIVISLSAKDALVILKIADDGSGFSDTRHDAAGTGLRIMRYRAELIRAALTFGQVFPRGALVTCTVPCGQGLWYTGRSMMSGATQIGSSQQSSG